MKEMGNKEQKKRYKEQECKAQYVSYLGQELRTSWCTVTTKDEQSDVATPQALLLLYCRRASFSTPDSIFFVCGLQTLISQCPLSYLPPIESYSPTTLAEEIFPCWMGINF
jgi:hypothetical protein